MPEIRKLIKAMASAKTGRDLTNQYAQDDAELDRTGGAAIRRKNIENYLRRFEIEPPRLIILAEAAGYRGCRFSGIVFTSEHTLLNDPFFKGGAFARSSARVQLWREASASIVWETLNQLQFRPLMWATVPFHPHNPGLPLTNRAPTQPERLQGFDFFLMLREIFPDSPIVAAGRIAEEALTKAKLEHTPVRHPSHGGKADFQAGLFKIAKKIGAAKSYESV